MPSFLQGGAEARVGAVLGVGMRRGVERGMDRCEVGVDIIVSVSSGKSGDTCMTLFPEVGHVSLVDS